MVKLRVTARIIPESEYLAFIDSTAHIGSIRGEKKFHVVVQEPEKWYIGTLANAVKQKYQNLYKHDLGQIKYLKNDEDECDLDPEEGVADLLVNEGRALVDKSDQTVVIKVIREEGRAVRHGSVIPDLTPTQYQLPTRPPVPRFENIESTLGKRNADDLLSAIDTSTSKRRRSRLSEIEEDNEIATSIERDLAADTVVQDSPPLRHTSTHEASSNIHDGRHEPTWSFSQLGPPVHVGSSTFNQTPVREHVNGLDAVGSGSPNLERSSSRKRFLRPTRDVYAYPESDIDDSQTSTKAGYPSKSAPQAVPGKPNGVHDAGQNLHKGTDLLPTVDESLSEQSEGINQSNASSVHSGDPTGHPTGIDGPNEATRASRDRTSVAALKRDRRRHSGRKSFPDVAQSDSQNGETDSNVMDILNSGKTQIDKANPLNQSPAKKAKRKESAAQDPSTAASEVANTQREQNSSQGSLLEKNNDLTTLSKKRQADAIGEAVSGLLQARKRQMSTPPPDSPSEQLSQALQESTRKRASLSNRIGLPAKDVAGTSNSNPENDISNAHTSPTAKNPQKDRRSSQSSGTSRIAITPRTSQMTLSSPTPAAKQPVARVGAAAKETQKRGARKVSTGKDQDPGESNGPQTKRAKKPASAPSAKSVDTDEKVFDDETSKQKSVEETGAPVGTREKSADSSATRSSNVILPPGMSRADFDRIIASNAHLNTEPAKVRAKSTPSLRTSVSRSSEVRQTENDTTNKGERIAASTEGQPPTLSKSGGRKSGQDVDIDLSKGVRTDLEDKARTRETMRGTNVGSSVKQKSVTSESSEQTAKPNPKATARKTPDGSVKAGSRRTPSVTPVTAAATAGKKETTPSVSSKSGITSKITFSTPTKPEGLMQPPTAKTASAKSKSTSEKRATTPKSQSARSVSTSSVPSIAKQTTKAATTTSTPTVAKISTTATNKRPTLAGPNSIYQARSLKELAKLSGSTYNSPSTSTAASPAVTTQHRSSFLGKAIGSSLSATANDKSKLLFNDDTDETDEDDDSDEDDEEEEEEEDDESSSDSNNSPKKNDNSKKPSNSSSITTPKPKPKTTTTTPKPKPSSSSKKSTTKTTPSQRPDPSIRDVSDSGSDNESESESGSSDSEDD